MTVTEEQLIRLCRDEHDNVKQGILDSVTGTKEELYEAMPALIERALVRKCRDAGATEDQAYDAVERFQGQ